MVICMFAIYPVDEYFVPFIYIYIFTLILRFLLSVGSADFVGINFYTSSRVFPSKFPVNDVSYGTDKEADFDLDPSWPR